MTDSTNSNFEHPQMKHDNFEQQCLELGLDVLSLDLVPTAEKTSPSGRLSKPWLLHVDGDLEFGESFETRMVSAGFNVARAFNGLEGIQSAFDHPAEVIVAEFDLANGQGDFLLRRLKANPITNAIPVVFLSSVCDRHLESQLLVQGAEAFYHKPTDYVELVSHLRRLTGQVMRFNASHLHTEFEPKGRDPGRPARRRPTRTRIVDSDV